MEALDLYRHRASLDEHRRLSYPQSHQRRHSSSSSSKPSNPADGSRGPPQQQQNSSTNASSQAPHNETQSSTRISRRKAKEAVAGATVKGKDQIVINLPSVPSTHHLHPAHVAVSAFFSLHRPISVTASVPSLASDRSFDTIFSARQKSTKPSQVIATLSSAVDSMEAAQQGQQPSYDNATDPDLHAAVTAASSSNGVHHLDAAPNDSPLQFPGHLLSGRYKPFTPPPAPTPVDASTTTNATANKVLKELPSTTLKKSYSTILTILERTHSNGSKTYTARASPITQADESAESEDFTEIGTAAGAKSTSSPSTFLGRMHLRQERWEEFRRERMGGWKENPEGEGGKDGGLEGMWAISVKRQRRLKMKKHKYKKLMRRTRNLRRRLEKT
ncbi:MAG: hypothetical protein M1837_006750 [Sclerophora amabilis]|nr:MAG: hypothetical protein M1837_006750 [Sclerophora amabilis]